MTGSTTRRATPPDRSRPATASTIAVLKSIPVFTASDPMSESTASICATTISTGTPWIAVTPSVFWAVIAVTTEAPYTPKAAKVLRSAWIPAPPPESEPAIVSARGRDRAIERSTNAIEPAVS